jgi:hypothetical protein
MEECGAGKVHGEIGGQGYNGYKGKGLDINVIRRGNSDRTRL